MYVSQRCQNNKPWVTDKLLLITQPRNIWQLWQHGLFLAIICILWEMETIPKPGSTKPLIQLLGREDRFTELLGCRDCLSLCHYAGAKAIISVEPGHAFVSKGTSDWEHLISPGRNIIHPIHKQISRLVINMRKAYMKQMAEGRRTGTSGDYWTARQGHMGWCWQPHALSVSIQGQPHTSCFTWEGTGDMYVWSEAQCDVAALLVGLSVVQQEHKRDAQLPRPMV